MKRYGSELEMISRIGADGRNLYANDELQDTRIDELFWLSSAMGTLIAHGHHTFVVKLKNPPKQ